MIRPRFVLILGALVICVGGCRPSGPAKARISGVVHLDGEVITKGTIQFVSVDPGVAGGIGKIKDGNYFAELQAGKMLVQISSLKSVKRDDVPDKAAEDIMEETVPAKYNKDTILEVDVRPGVQQQDFPLRSK
jgi:hypothetical protein